MAFVQIEDHDDNVELVVFRPYMRRNPVFGSEIKLFIVEVKSLNATITPRKF